MAGAAVYGFVDFRKASRQDAFRNIYSEGVGKESESLPAPPNDHVPVMKEVTVKEMKARGNGKVESESKGEVRKKKKRVELEKFSRAALAEEFEPVILEEKVK